MATHSISLPGIFHGQRSLLGYSPSGCQRVWNSWATKQQQTLHRIDFDIFIRKLNIKISCVNQTEKGKYWKHIVKKAFISVLPTSESLNDIKMWFKKYQQTLVFHVYNICSLRARNLPILFPVTQHLAQGQHTDDSQWLFVDWMSFVLCHTHGSENLSVEAQVPIIIRKTDDDCHCFLKSVTWSPSGMLSCDGMWQRWSRSGPGH